MNTKKILIIIFVVSLSVRLFFGIYIFNKEGTAKFSDDWEYINFANNIRQNGIFSPYEASLVGPAFPLIISMSFMIFGEVFLPVIILNALVSSFLCILIFSIGRELFNERVGICASLWSIFYVLFIRYTPHVLKENWLAFLFPLVILLIFKETKRDKISLYFLLLLSILYSFLIHMDERYFAYLPIFVSGFVFLDKKSWKMGIFKFTLFFLMLIIFMAPWLIRNYNVYNKIVILTPRTTPLTDRIFGYKRTPFFDISLARWFISDKHIKKAQNGEKVRRHDGEKVGDKQLKAIRDGILPHTFSRLESYCSIFQILWKPIDLKRGYSTTGYRYDGKWSLKHNLSIGLTYGLLIPFFLYGLVLLLRYRWKIGVFLTSIFIYHTLIHMFFIPYTRNRYRIPIDAFIIVIAFYGIRELFKLYKRKKVSLIGQKEFPSVKALSSRSCRNAVNQRRTNEKEF
jgi:4-amino-4-deoxy-L-arabinose transferase-like glycosyltransferase